MQIALSNSIYYRAFDTWRTPMDALERLVTAEAISRNDRYTVITSGGNAISRVASSL